MQCHGRESILAIWLWIRKCQQRLHLSIRFRVGNGVFHFGSLSITDEKIKDVTRVAVEMAKEGGALISFEPNLCPPLCESLEKAKEKIAYGISQCHILKISDDEIEFFAETSDIDEGVVRIQKEFNTPFICVTMGRMGSIVDYHGERVECKPFLCENTIETTGAGDTFMACVLNMVLENGWNRMDRQKLYEMLEFANAAASIITTKKVH